MINVLYIYFSDICTQPVGGNTIVEQCKLTLEDQGIEIVPYYKIASKQEVAENQKSIWTKKSNIPEVRQSFEDYAVKASASIPFPLYI